MKLYDRITFYKVVLAVTALVVLPTAIAQIPGPGGMRGGVGDRGGRGGGRGDDMGLSGRGGERGRGGGPGPWMREELTDTQIDLILKAYSARDPDEAKKLQEQRKDMTREVFVQTLISSKYAMPEFYQIMSDERRYTPILEWCERWVAEEAKGIRDLKKDNYDSYKKRLDALENKYRSIIYRRDTPEELIPVLVKNLQLGLKQNELEFQIGTANQSQKDSLIANLTEVVRERYYLNIQQRTIELKEIQNRIDSMQRFLEEQKNQIEIQKDPNVADAEIQARVIRLTDPTDYYGGLFGGRGRPGRGNRGRPQFSRPDVNDPNSRFEH